MEATNHVLRIVEMVWNAEEMEVAIAFLKHGVAQRLAPMLGRISTRVQWH